MLHARSRRPLNRAHETKRSQARVRWLSSALHLFVTRCDPTPHLERVERRDRDDDPRAVRWLRRRRRRAGRAGGHAVRRQRWQQAEHLMMACHIGMPLLTTKSNGRLRGGGRSSTGASRRRACVVLRAQQTSGGVAADGGGAAAACSKATACSKAKMPPPRPTRRHAAGSEHMSCGHVAEDMGRAA